MDASNQSAIDRAMIELDGTENKSELGANAILGCSIAVAYAAANEAKLPLFRWLGGDEAVTLPVPMIQIIGGGAHAVDTTDIQDYLVIPMKAKSFAEALEVVVNVYNATKKVFQKYHKPLAIADEGGFWPTGFKTNSEGLDLLTEGIELAGYRPMEDVAIALDIASSEFYKKENGTYRLEIENRTLSREEMVEMLVDWTRRYPIISIEDGCSELDWEGSVLLTEKLGKKVQLIGDDLFTTSIPRIKTGVDRGACNSVLIKTNQIGSITETLEAIRFTQECGYLPVVSARSGETEDAVITHIAVATNAGQLKVGSVARSERGAKWNEALRIERFLKNAGTYPSGRVFDSILK